MESKKGKNKRRIPSAKDPKKAEPEEQEETKVSNVIEEVKQTEEQNTE